ncbi:ISAs1 family transposase, partial [Anaplasma marginale]|uniref:ISAs1 family transposase n=1 Tax=Anaplasma marginale TaxID=770 RepID=UPI0005B3DCAD
MSLGFTSSSLDKKKKKNSSSNDISFLKNSFLNHFKNLSDPRTGNRKDHLLIDIVAISILAVISNADNWNAIETYGQAKEDWLRTFLELPNGIPSHDTFNRVFQRLNPEEFATSFTSWINLIVQKLGAEVIAIDGKTLKQSYDRNDFQKALHIVSAWANENKLVLAQKKVDSKSNEITAIPALLDSLDITGNIITIDAMGTQKEIAKLIINKKADYILALKGNQGKLHKQVKDWLENAKNNNFSGIEYSYNEQLESGHHRIEKRQVYSVPISELPPLHNQNKWLGLKTVIMVVSERILWNETTYDVRFYISSIES